MVTNRRPCFGELNMQSNQRGESSMKNTIVVLALASAVSAANAATTTMTFSGLVDVAIIYPQIFRVGDEYTFIATFDTLPQNSVAGYTNAVGEIDVFRNGGQVWDCSTLTGCNGFKNETVLVTSQYETAPGEFITWRDETTQSTSASISLYRNMDGSVDLSRSGVNMAWSYSHCETNLVWGQWCDAANNASAYASGIGFSDYIQHAAGRSEGDNFEAAFGSSVTASISTSPVPEGNAGLMALAGFAAVGVVVRRRKSSGQRNV